MRYTLNDFTDITFNGFDIKLPDETLSIITELSLQVGSPTYIKTPIFAKREHNSNAGGNTIFSGLGETTEIRKRRRGNKPVEVLNDGDWESIRTFQTTVIEQKVGIDAQIDLIRSSLNKMTEKNYGEHSSKIIEILNQLIGENVIDEEMLRVGNAIFEIASNNRFFSKLYADLYTLLINQFHAMRSIFDTNFDAFLEIFKTIESSNPDENYEHYCKVTKDNERRKALSSFFVNLTINNVIVKDKLIDLTFHLINKVLVFMKEENKKSEVDEIIENIFILYNKEWFENSCQKIEDQTFIKVIENLARSKAKDYPSLSNKTIFKCMDMIEM
jgi:hypothetical protein